MVKACCIAGCKVTSAKDVSYFKFPISRNLRKKWLDIIKPARKPSATAQICSRHFLKSDYEQVRGRTRLKAEVVPSVFAVEINNKPNSKDIPKNTQNATPSDIINSKNKKKVRSRTSIDKNKQETENKDLGEKIDSEEDISKDKGDIQKELREETLNEGSSEKNNKESVLDKGELGEKESQISNNIIDIDIGLDDSVNKREKRVSEEINGERRSKESKIEDLRNEDSSQKERSEEKQDKCIESTPLLPAGPPDIDKPEDIEELLTNYQIKQNNIHKTIEDLSVGTEKPGPDVGETSEIIDVSDYPVEGEKQDPVFIEVAVDQDPNTSSDKADCLMLLESVQVEVDPGALMLHEGEGDGEGAGEGEVRVDDETIHIKDDDPISLLTSTDEDEVIIQEPHIDTVEVSDEDEDDVPLNKLIKTKNKVEANIGKMLWGMYEYYCVECHFRTTNRADYKKHTRSHQKIILMCQLCGYMTSSETQLARHEKQHKEEKKYQCHLCDYKAKHNMSLIYHMKSHKKKRKGYSCGDCNFKMDSETDALKHVVRCSVAGVKKHKCDKCEYSTNKPSDLRRHQARRHRESDDSDD